MDFLTVMKDIWEYLCEFNPVSMLVRILLAALAGGLVGIERGYHGRAAGLRTHMLVCLGAALTAIIGSSLSIEMSRLGINSDAQRTAAQVMSGVGFLGAGTILLKRGNNSQVTGLTTAAGLWATAAVGLAVGFGLYLTAFFTVFVIMLVFTILSRMEFRINRSRHRVFVYLEIESVDYVNYITERLTRDFAASEVQVTPPRSGTNPHVGVEALVHIPVKSSEESRMAKLQQVEHVVFSLLIS